MRDEIKEMKMKGLTTYKRTIKIRLKSIADSKKASEVLINHYTHILEHFDDIIATHDKDIAEIDERKAEVLKQFIAAPQELKELNRHLATLTETRQNVTEKDGKVKRVKHLRERLATLLQECERDGIDVDEHQNDTDELKKEVTETVAANKAEGEAVAAKEAAELI